MFTEATRKWLEEFDFPKYTQEIRSKKSETESILTDLGFEPDSEIVYFYKNYGALSARGWYELLEPREIEEMTEYAHSELEIPEFFIALTSFEGSGMSLVDKRDSKIYDITLGEIEDLIDLKTKPIADTFEEYLLWRKNRHENNA